MAKELTLILAGKLGVGKTSLFRRVQTGTFVSAATPEHVSITSQANSTKSEEELEYFLYNVTLGEQEYKISLWDTGGLERYHSMTANYFRFCHSVMLVYDARPDCINTLFVLRDWVNDARTNNFLGEGMTLSLWANKSDQLAQDYSRPEEVVAFMGEYNIPESLYFPVSAKTGLNVMESFHALIEHISTNHTHNNGHVSSTSTAPDVPSNNTAQQEQKRRCFKC